MHGPFHNNPDAPVDIATNPAIPKKTRKLHNPFCLCGLFAGMRSVGYFDVCSFLIDLFMVVLTFISKYPYKTWGVIQILRTLALFLLVATP